MARMTSTAEQVTLAVLAGMSRLPYFQVDADRNVVGMSPAMERLTGFKAADMIGRSCLEIHRCEECLRGCGVFDNLTVTDKHLELYRSDGSTVRVRKSGRVFFGDDGEVSGALEVVRPLKATAPAATRPARFPGGVEVLAHPEAILIRDALKAARYRRAEAARSLGMSRTTLWRKMKAYGL